MSAFDFLGPFFKFISSHISFIHSRDMAILIKNNVKNDFKNCFINETETPGS